MGGTEGKVAKTGGTKGLEGLQTTVRLEPTETSQSVRR